MVAVVFAPLRRAQEGERLVRREGDQRGDPQQRVGGVGDRGQVLVGGRGADLGVAGADEGFFPRGS